MKRCSCAGHRNLDYLTYHTSLASFISSVSCPQVGYPTLSENGSTSIDIKKQEEENVSASNEKEKRKIEKGENNNSRNTRREGPARQKKSIALVSWGGLFTCNQKKCAYQQCQNYGVLKFFSGANLCNAERNENFVVKVRKYENIPER